MKKQYALELIDFLDKSPVNFLAIDTLRKELEKNGFERLCGKDKWELKKGGKYYMVKNKSALFAFIIGNENIAEKGFHLISSHSDSPCFSIEPNPVLKTEGDILNLTT